MKKIILCVKEVPNTDKIKIDHTTGLLKRESCKTILNPPDETALYWALALKKQFDYFLTVITMGPPHSLSLLKYILALGANQAYLITDPAFSGSDTLATSRILSSAIQFIGPADLVFFGAHTLDGDTGQIPGQVSEFLQLPSYSYIENITQNSSGQIILTQKTETTQKILVQPPCALSFNQAEHLPFMLPQASQFFFNHQPSIISNIHLNIPPEQIGLKGSPTQVKQVRTPTFSKHSTIEIFSRQSIAKIMNLIEKIKKT